MTTARDVTKDLMEKSVALVMATTKLSIRRSVSTDKVEVDADKTMLHVAKNLLDSAELRAIVSHDSLTRRWIDARALPSPLFRAGVHLYPVSMVPEFVDYIERRLKERADLIQGFLDAYPGLVVDARRRLGVLFDESQYPRRSELREVFTLSYAFVEWGPATGLKNISKALYDREAAKAEAEWAVATEQIKAALLESTAEVVDHMVDRLAGGDDGQPKRFKEASISRVTDFLESFGKRNIVGYKDLEALVEKARKAMSGVDAASLRGDDKVRASVVKAFAEVKKTLDTMTEARPRRRMSLGEEE